MIQIPISASCNPTPLSIYGIWGRIRDLPYLYMIWGTSHPNSQLPKPIVVRHIDIWGCSCICSPIWRRQRPYIYNSLTHSTDRLGHFRPPPITITNYWGGELECECASRQWCLFSLVPFLSFGSGLSIYGEPIGEVEGLPRPYRSDLISS